MAEHPEYWFVASERRSTTGKSRPSRYTIACPKVWQGRRLKSIRLVKTSFRATPEPPTVACLSVDLDVGLDVEWTWSNLFNGLLAVLVLSGKTEAGSEARWLEKPMPLPAELEFAWNDLGGEELHSIPEHVLELALTFADSPDA